MKLTDRDLKMMVTRVCDIHSKVGTIETKVAVIETKCIDMESHLRGQNDRLNKHATRIGSLEVNQEGLKVSQKFLMLIVGGAGGLVGSILTIFFKAGIEAAVNGGMIP